VDSVKAPPKPIMVCFLFFVLIETDECCSDFWKSSLTACKLPLAEVSKTFMFIVFFDVQPANPMTVIKNQTDFFILFCFIKTCFNNLKNFLLLSINIYDSPIFFVRRPIIRYARTVRGPATYILSIRISCFPPTIGERE